jgi:hypothetical protein
VYLYFIGHILQIDIYQINGKRLNRDDMFESMNKYRGENTCSIKVVIVRRGEKKKETTPTYMGFFSTKCSYGDRVLDVFFFLLGKFKRKSSKRADHGVDWPIKD